MSTLQKHPDDWDFYRDCPAGFGKNEPSERGQMNTLQRMAKEAAKKAKGFRTCEHEWGTWKPVMVFQDEPHKVRRCKKCTLVQLWKAK